MIANTALLGFLFLMLCAVWTDVRQFTIPNWIPGVMIVLWLAASPFLDLTWGQAGLALASGFGVLALGLALWAPGWVGGGDVKLLAAGALWFGWPDTLSFLLMTVVAGGVLSVALVLLRSAVRFVPSAAPVLSGGVLAPGKPAPYAVAIAAGALIVLPQAAVFTAYAG